MFLLQLYFLQALDSSIIANCLNKNNIELNTHTLGFESNTIYKNINEIEAASNYARHLKSNPTSLIYKKLICSEMN